MKQSKLREMSKSLAIKIVNTCDNIEMRRGRGVLINQITKSATSIGANINEVNYASSRADFINKLHIALKECIETEYWIELLSGTGCISEDITKELQQECGSIHFLLVKSINTAKSNENR